MAGTHDIELGLSTIKSLVQETHEDVLVPVFDKSKNDGHGDRLDRDHWIRQRTPVDLVIVEGWMLGYRPVSSQVLSEHMIEVNDNLKKYKQWDDLYDAAIIAGVESPDIVY